MAEHLLTTPSFRGAGVAEENWQELASSGNATPVDLAGGGMCSVPLTENTTMGNPTNAHDGQRVTFLFLNTASNRVVSWGTKYKLSGGTVTITVGVKHSTMEFMYRATDDAWYELTRSLNI